ncbi:uncharacterized protein LOC102357752 [Latimeria chalumnae]|uniref:uncharacterized protein LOC102357752 n=1 Tax=Latimeria chalumnae TaxID=7897 RepID=UPI0003C109E4|nr:PREDICTED: uncharacterized protein LOC102357752 [Latimeria chalumnae]|eukprot:XP_006011726.1 PREDICTED: uncharacterized protein LOC102357752 [Latimeria chalumnae]
MSYCAVVPSEDIQKMNITQGSLQVFTKFLPAAEKVALLFNLSYLHLANFPELEALIRSNVVESQHLFLNSSNLLLQCGVTSRNIVDSLFPVMKIGAENNDLELAQNALYMTLKWTQEMYDQTKEVKEGYQNLSTSISNNTSKVVDTKRTTETAHAETSDKVKLIKEKKEKQENKYKKAEQLLDNKEKEINQANDDLNNLLNKIAEENRKYAIVAAAVPLIGLIVYGFKRLIDDPKEQREVQIAEKKVKDLEIEKNKSQIDCNNLEVQVFNTSMELVKEKAKNKGLVGDISHLNEVQKILTKVEAIIEDIMNFWQQAGIRLKSMEQKTKSSSLFFKDLQKYKKPFLEAIEVAESLWIVFANCCVYEKQQFEQKRKQLYTFLEVDPAQLDEATWNKEIQDVSEKLKAFVSQENEKTANNLKSLESDNKE